MDWQDGPAFIGWSSGNYKLTWRDKLRNFWTCAVPLVAVVVLLFIMAVGVVTVVNWIF